VTTTVVDLPPDTAAADAGELVAGVAGTDVALVVVEVVTNPLIAVVDVPAVAAAAHRCGAVCLVDSTFATPFLFQPLAHGADLVMHSLTKHLGGHSDVLGGVALAADGSEAAGWLDSTSRALGAVLAPFDAWLTQRGLRTAPLRVERGSATAASLAVALDGHPALAAVHHPAVRGAGEGSLARRLLPRGTGPMLSLEVRGGRPAAGRVVRAMGGIRLAPSLGDVGTTVSHPATTSHRHLSPEARQALGISDGLLRFSVGIEDETVLRAELEAGLDAAR
jgi:cystathionine beta-lyase/cystathionine gamma-synthase